MPVIDQYERLSCAAIVVNRDQRQRRNLQTTDLEESITRLGVLQPIIVARTPDGPLLVAGERRLAASKALGLPDVPVRWAEDLSEIELRIIELEENVKRQDLEWQDRVRAVEQIHQLHLQLDPDWTMTETATSAGLTLPTVSMYLRTAGELGDNARVAAAGTVREAYNVLARRDAREQGEALDELLGLSGSPPDGPPAEPGAAESEPVACASFLDWAASYSGPKFNLLHCDFPYGGHVFSGPQARGSDETEALYDDDPEVYFALLDSLCINLDRFASLSCHLMFWCSSRIADPTSQYARETWQRFHSLAPSLSFWQHPLIWVKSDQAGIASDPRHGPRHVYETCLLASRGSRQIARVVNDAYVSPSDRSLHPSAKPEPMLRHFMTMLVDSTTSVLDPTCGAGSSLRAADSLGARSVLGLEIDPSHARVANTAFRNSRTLRSASHQAARSQDQDSTLAEEPFL